MSNRLPLEDRAPELDLSVGALVVYGSHGVGRIRVRNSESGKDPEASRVVLDFASGLSVILPLERAEACLRPTASPSELDDVRATLRSRSTPNEQPAQARRRTTQSKIVVGDPVGLAEVVRDAVERQRQFARGSTLSPTEQELYQKARRLLAAELVVVADIDEAEAEAWIESQLDRTDDQ